MGTCQRLQGFDATIIDAEPKVSPTQAKLLCQRFTMDESKAALFDVCNDKSLGLDRYTSFFFKKTWNLMGEDFCATILEFFEIGKLLKKTNHSIISLIPKNDHGATVGYFRLISCCNVFYKVITKLLVERLGEILPTIIDKA